MSRDPKIEMYLGEVRALLARANAGEEEKVVRQITERILTLSAKPGSTADSAIAELGPAAIVARRFRDANLIARAAKSNSPLLLLHASLGNGIKGVLAFVLGLAGYWLGGCIAVFGTLVLAWSAFHYTPNANAAIGSSMIEDAIVIAVGLSLLVLTTVLLRALLRKAAARELRRDGMAAQDVK
jgi:hypothetical protein